MRTFRCTCGSRVFFENTRCLTCGRGLGFLPDAAILSAIEPKADGVYSTGNGDYRKCRNYVEEGVCNWMIPASLSGDFCQACQLNHVIPDLSLPDNRLLWAEVEKAKRRLVYTLNRLHLSLRSKAEDPVGGVAFDIKADQGSTRVLTGHDDGLITLNLGEADAAAREAMRVSMKERYRTLVGHFRHEIGHYYWDRLVRDDPNNLARFRELFGDETMDYAEALRRHYASPPSEAYAESFITPYAAAHPWEDFAETFAHYLHLEDTLETGHHFGFTGNLPERESVVDITNFDLLVAEWTELTIALNALNRSMGLPDAYPFAISARVAEKLELVHTLVRNARQQVTQAQRVEPAAQSQPAPMQPAPMQPAPMQPAPMQPAPMQPAPMQPAPMQPAPAQPAPMEPAPAQPAAQPQAVTQSQPAPLPTGTQPQRPSQPDPQSAPAAPPRVGPRAPSPRT